MDDQILIIRSALLQVQMNGKLAKNSFDDHIGNIDPIPCADAPLTVSVTQAEGGSPCTTC